MTAPRFEVELALFPMALDADGCWSFCEAMERGAAESCDVILTLTDSETGRIHALYEDEDLRPDLARERFDALAAFLGDDVAITDHMEDMR